MNVNKEQYIAFVHNKILVTINVLRTYKFEYEQSLDSLQRIDNALNALSALLPYLT